MKKLLTTACLFVVTTVVIVSFTASTVFGQEQKTADVSSLNVTAQTESSTFTVEDLLDVENFNIADLSNDGKWLAATSSSLRNRIGIVAVINLLEETADAEKVDKLSAIWI